MNTELQRQEVEITLTLNRVTKKVTGIMWGWKKDEITVYGIDMMTTSGTKVHKGSLKFKRKEGDVYTDRDIGGIYYFGMIGSGHGRTSRFRYVGFPKE